MKRYLVTRHECYYPEGGDSDWVGCFETYEEAQKQAQKESEKFNKKFNDGFVEIIDLAKWIGAENYEEQN